MKKILSVILTLIMIFSVAPMSDIIVGAETSNGVTGDCTWSIEGTILTITGQGNMENYDTYNQHPWGTDITEVVIEEGVKSIGNCAFKDCASLTAVSIPDTISSVGVEAFYGCSNLEFYVENKGKYLGNQNNPNVVLIGNELSNFSKEFEILDGTKFIYDVAVADKQALKFVTIPETVISIGVKAFSGCVCIESLKIPESVLTIGDYAFNDCKKLKKVDFSFGLENIGEFAFRSCVSIIDLTLPDSVLNIGKSAFAGCENLVNVTMPENLSAINENLFMQCLSLKKIKIPSGVSVIYDGAFNWCENLESIYLPDSVIKIGSGTFDLCNQLKEIWYEGSEESRDSINIGSDNSSFYQADWYLNVCKNNEHTYDNDCDEICNICQFPRETQHNFSDATCLAPKTCINCGEIEGEKLSEHTYDEGVITTEPNCKDEGVKTYTCTVCGDFYTEAVEITDNHHFADECDMECDVCGENRTVEHFYYDECDTDCDKCGYVREVEHDFAPATCTKPMTCKNCQVTSGKKLGHDYKDATCTKPKTCKRCDKTSGEKLGHDYKKATCTKPKTCKVCGKTSGEKLGHKYTSVITKATELSNGKYTDTCSKCKKVKSGKIYKIDSIKLSTDEYAYNGKAKKPSVKVKDSKGNVLTENTDYTVNYDSGRKNVGRYKVSVTFKGKYFGKKSVYFEIVPKKSSVSSVTAAKKSLKVKIKKVSSQATGYEIQYSTSKKFTKSTTKTKKVTSYKTTSVTIKSLKSKKTYYVRVRTYKTVGGKKYYSNWSSYKSKKTK